MSVILILMLASLTVALVFLGAFIWAVRSGQFEDTATPPMRILSEDHSTNPTSKKTKPELHCHEPRSTHCTRS